MIAPQACVAVEITSSPASQEQWGALERRCSEILGPRRCRIVMPGQDDIGAGCWRAVVTAEGGDTPTDASVVLSDETEPEHTPVRRDVTFRPNDAVPERWATLGLVIAAPVTVEEHSAAEDAPAASWSSAGGGFAPIVGVQRDAPAPASAPLAGEARVSGIGSLGFLPEASVGARLEVSVTKGAFELLARGSIFPGNNRATFSSAGAGGDLQLWLAGLGVCGTGGRGRWSARACLGGDLARTTARGYGVSETSVDRVWWESVWTGASVELGLFRHLALTLDVEAALLLERPSFAIVGAPAVFTPSPVGGTLALGVAVPF
jgi:hypothetical protein